MRPEVELNGTFPQCPGSRRGGIRRGNTNVHVLDGKPDTYVRQSACAGSSAPSREGKPLHGLYVIEAKSGFDCDPTLFQAEEDLKTLKYLYRIPLHRLPAEAQQYVIEVTDSGIPGISAVSDNLSYDEQTGECLVTASSPLWEKLVQSGVLPASADVRLRDMSALEITEQIMSLAAGRLEKKSRRQPCLFRAGLLVRAFSSDPRSGCSRVSARRRFPGAGPEGSVPG